MSEASGVLELLRKAEELSAPYENVVIAQINDHVVRMSLMTEPYFWHVHPDSDELFLNLKGTLILELEGRRIELNAGQIFMVPKGAKHRTAPAGDRSVNLTFERADIVTVRVDEPST